MVGAAVAVGLGAVDRARKRRVQQAHEKLTVKDL
jgi:hypothetical protein